MLLVVVQVMAVIGGVLAGGFLGAMAGAFVGKGGGVKFFAVLGAALGVWFAVHIGGVMAENAKNPSRGSTSKPLGDRYFRT